MHSEKTFTLFRTGGILLEAIAAVFIRETKDDKIFYGHAKAALFVASIHYAMSLARGSHDDTIRPILVSAV